MEQMFKISHLFKNGISSKFTFQLKWYTDQYYSNKIKIMLVIFILV